MWYPIRAIIRFIPFKWVYFLGAVGGRVLYLISREKRTIMAEEFRMIFPDKNIAEIKKIVKYSFMNYCISEMEVLLYPVMDSKFIEKILTIEGNEHLDRSLAGGKGVLLFQAHFGAFQMTMPAIGYSGYTMNQISASASIWKEDSSSEIQKRSAGIKAKYEHTLPVRHISIESSLRPVFRALERNEIVGVTVDGGGGKKTVSIPFLGRTANFQQGAADLALRTGAEIVPVFIVTEKGLKHRLVIHSALNLNTEKDKKDIIKGLLVDFASLLENYVYKYPNHYGYTLCLRKSRASIDPYPFFADHQDTSTHHTSKAVDYV